MRYPMRVLLLSMACSAALSAQAQAAPGRIDLPAGELATALNTLAKQSGTKQIIMITDGEPTAHVMPNGQIFFDYPTRPETRDATLRQVMLCTKEDIVINTFMLDPNPYLSEFVEKMSQLNGGRAFFTTPENLGDYVLVDFLNNKREMLRGRRAG